MSIPSSLDLVYIIFHPSSPHIAMAMLANITHHQLLPMTTHEKATQSPYPSGPSRFPVPATHVRYAVPFPDYAPVSYTAKVVADEPVWADRSSSEFLDTAQWNALDATNAAATVDRRSRFSWYCIDATSRLPLNPVGRTGIVGRGLLGRFGPNHAADPIVTRWRRAPDNSILCDPTTGVQLLEFVAIQRSDNGQWAIPGGMINPGENVTATLKREFGEEALATLDRSPEDRIAIKDRLDGLFSNPAVVYRGYVDDPRNTDNAWMETVVAIFHDDTGAVFSDFPLRAGDDAKNVAWVSMDTDTPLYASHSQFVEHARSVILSIWGPRPESDTPFTSSHFD